MRKQIGEENRALLDGLEKLESHFEVQDYTAGEVPRPEHRSCSAGCHRARFRTVGRVVHGIWGGFKDSDSFQSARHVDQKALTGGVSHPWLSCVC